MGYGYLDDILVGIVSWDRHKKICKKNSIASSMIFFFDIIFLISCKFDVIMTLFIGFNFVHTILMV